MKLIEKIPVAFEGLLANPVGIFGADGNGHAVAQLLKKAGIHYVVYDEKSGENIKVRRSFGETEAKVHGLIIHGPAYDQSHPWYKCAQDSECEIVSELEFAHRFRNGPLIAVTGTNGKTTMAEFITFALKRIGRPALAISQAQYPLSKLAMFPDQDGAIAVCEISNDYAVLLKNFKAEIIFWTNFHEDHFNDEKQRQESFASYFHLLNLNRNARIYLGESVQKMAQDFGIELPANAKVCAKGDYSHWDLPNDSAFSTVIHWNALKLFETYWEDEGLAESQLKSAVESFDVRAHRLHICSRVEEVAYWNDSKSSNFAATEAALSNFSEPVIWIGGGRYRGGDLNAFFERIEKQVKVAIFTGEDGKLLAEAWNVRGRESILANNVKEAVESAHQLTKGKGHVVFSPGFIGGKILGGFQESGIYFENAVLGLKHRLGSI